MRSPVQVFPDAVALSFFFIEIKAAVGNTGMEFGAAAVLTAGTEQPSIFYKQELYLMDCTVKKGGAKRQFRKNSLSVKKLHSRQFSAEFCAK